MRLTQCLGNVGDVADAKGDRIRIKMCIGKGQRLSILCGPDEAVDAALHRAFHAHIQHVFVNVRNGYLRTGFFHAEGNVACATCHVENILPCARFYPTDKAVFPQSVHAARHCVVHNVVFACDIGKDVAYALRLFFGANLLIAKGYGVIHRVDP